MWRTPLSFITVILAIGILFLNFLSVRSEKGKFGSGFPVTPRELEALEKFKPIAKRIVTRDYQREDGYLLNWIRSSGNDIGKAKQRLEKSMAWRKENNVDSILDNPEMKNMEKRLKFTVDTVDKHGHPIVVSDLRRWDIRRLILAGKSEAFELYFIYIYETAMKRARELSASTGKDISEFVIMFDTAGFSTRKHACLACLSALGRAVTNMENNYAGFIEYIIAANTPRGFDVIVDFLRPIMSVTTKNRLKIFSRGSPEPKKFFNSFIDNDQLGRQFGGKRRIRQ